MATFMLYMAGHHVMEADNPAAMKKVIKQYLEQKYDVIKERLPIQDYCKDISVRVFVYPDVIEHREDDPRIYDPKKEKERNKKNKKNSRAKEDDL